MIAFGVALKTSATLSGTIGKHLLRFSKLAERAGDQALLSRLSLCIGVALNLFGGPALEMIAYGQAPQVLLAPLSGLEVLWNIILVPHTLGELPTFRQHVGCLSIVFGTGLTAIAGPHTELPYTLKTLQERLWTKSALMYFMVDIPLIALGVLFLCRCPHNDRKRGFVLGLVAGGIGGNLFCMKVTSTLIQHSFANGREDFADVWATPFALAVAAMAAAIALSGAYLLMHAMREYDATRMVATYEGAFVLTGCASGCAVLGELDVVGLPQRIVYSLGALMVVAGVLATQPPETYDLNGEHGLLDGSDADPLLLKGHHDAAPGATAGASVLYGAAGDGAGPA